MEIRWAHGPEAGVLLSFCRTHDRGYNHGLALGAGSGFAGASDDELGAGGAFGKTLIVGEAVALAGGPNLGGATVDGVSGFADFENVRSNWLASIAA